MYNDRWLEERQNKANSVSDLKLGDPIFSLHISSSWVEIRLHTKNQHPRLSRSALKVSLVVGWWVVVILSTLSLPT
jgi:hypothetical protein